MAYQAETQLPPLAAMTFFQWETLTAPNPALSASISSTATTIQVTAAPKDETGAVIQKAFLMGIKNDDSYVETVLVPTGSLAYDAQTANFVVGAILTGGTSGAKAKILRDTDAGTTGTLTLLVYSGTFQDNETITTAAGGSATANGTLTAAISADGLTFTGCVRGVRLTGLDFTSAGTGLATSFDAGSAVSCNITGVMQQLMFAVLQGTIATGGSDLIMGTDADGTVTIKRSTGTGTSVGWVRWNTTGDMAQFSNDGASWVNFSDSNSSTTFKVSAADTTPSYLDSKVDVATSGRLTKSIGNAGGNETLQLNLATTLTDAEMNAMHTGISANVTGTNLATLTAGSSSNADALHTHSSPVFTATAYEAITANDAVASLPISVEWFTPLTEVALNIGNTNATRGYGIKIIPTVTSSSLTTMLFRAAEAVNGATNGNLDISIQTDSAGSPSGTIISNGSANQITQATLRTWNTTLASQTATWAAAPTLTAGTTYWIVFKMDFTDATNYIKLGENSTYDENYLTMTRQTFNSAGSTWGSAVTNATPFFWFNNQPNILGMALCKCDADWGGRTWAFVGFAKDNISANASGSIYYDNITSLTGLSPGKDYYLSSTAGGISKTYAANEFTEGTAPSVYYYKIGTALNTTTLRIQKGLKRILLREKDVLTATTTRNYIFWFKPEILRASFSNFSSDGVNNDSQFSNGYGVDMGTGSTANMSGTGMSYNFGANGTTTGNNGSNIYLTSDVSRGFTGSSSISGAGVVQTYSMSNNGNIRGYIEVEAY